MKIQPVLNSYPVGFNSLNRISDALEKISLRAQDQLEKLKRSTLDPKEIEIQMELVLRRWSDQVRRLGGIPLEAFRVKIPRKPEAHYWALSATSSKIM